MKKALLLSAAAILLLGSCGPRSLSGQFETIEKGIARSYETIFIKGNIDVEVVDEANIMTVTGDSNLLKLVKIKVTDKEVRIIATASLLRKADSPRVMVSLPFGPRLKELKMDGTSSFHFPKSDIGPDLTIETKGANYVYAIMAMENLVIKADGSDKIMVDCVCDYADIDAKGSCVIGSEKGPICADRLKIFTFGTSEAYVEAPGNAFGAAEGDSRIYLRGEHDYTKLKAKDRAKVIPYDI